MSLRALALALLLAAPAHAGSLAGVTMPDRATVGGQAVVLNGMGLREKYFFDIYVGGLYLPARTTAASEAIQPDVAKRIVLHFIYEQVTAAQLVEAFEEGLAWQPGAAAVRPQFDRLAAMMEDVRAGDEISFDYAPGAGTRVVVNGVDKGTIAGADFMRAFVAVFVGEQPPTAKLKRGLLGG